jgi:hypothetical protein
MRYVIYRQGEKSESSESLDGNEESKHGLSTENPWDFCGIPRAPAV